MTSVIKIDGEEELCAICLDKIVPEETALVKGCEHAYCVSCILQWATYSQIPTCPRCKRPFEFLNVRRSLDGSLHDNIFEESVSLLIRATWFDPSIVEEREEVYVDLEYYYYPYENEDDDRWGDNGHVRGRRQEARPVHRPNFQGSSAGSSREPKNKEVANNVTGRRAKRALKREAADKAAAVKHQEHLVRLCRK